MEVGTPTCTSTMRKGIIIDPILSWVCAAGEPELRVLTDSTDFCPTNLLYWYILISSHINLCVVWSVNKLCMIYYFCCINCSFLFRFRWTPQRVYSSHCFMTSQNAFTKAMVLFLQLNYYYIIQNCSISHILIISHCITPFLVVLHYPLLTGSLLILL